MRTALETPWKITNELQRWLALPYVRLLFALNGIRWGAGWRFYGAPLLLCHRQSVMQLGDGLQLRSTLASNPLGANHRVVLCTWQAGARLEIGANFGMTGGVICAAERVTIGAGVNIGANSTIIDTDFHPLEAGRRKLDPQGAETAPVVIEDEVFVGMHSLILKGVRIGRGTVIGAGSVVSRDIPAGVIAAGNPAKVIREL